MLNVKGNNGRFGFIVLYFV